MCGFVGFHGGKSLTVDESRNLLTAMGDRIYHRGPDFGNTWCDPEAHIGLAHRRLAVVDLTEAGAQPMVSPSGRYVMAYNGEVYNHMDLRRALERTRHSPPWRGHSDTESLLASIEVWGLQVTLQRVIGMFAFALWDRQRREITLARDRFGEKPLYYGWVGCGTDRVLLFGSELKALRVHPVFNAGIDRGALCLLMRHNYIPAPWSIYEHIYKLPPAQTITFSITSQLAEPRPYWVAEQAVLDGARRPFEGSFKEASDELEHLLRDAIGRQMVADVPLGAFLSGGIDSSLVVALMQSQSVRPIKTFTIGSTVSEYNEGPYAKAVASYLGTEHTELYVSPEDAMDVIPALPTIYCEPFADSSQIPAYLVSHLARQHVTVSLSGDGADEFFAGYNRYLMTSAVWRKLRCTPRIARRIVAAILQSVSPRGWDNAANLIPTGRLFTAFGDKVHKAASVLEMSNSEDLFYSLVSNIRDPENWILGGIEHPTRMTRLRPLLPDIGDVQRMIALDTISYLPDDIMVKVDRAAMACSLETRAPFLDHRIYEFACRLPLHMKLEKLKTKRVLREILFRYVPPALIERPKSGFSVPIDRWLRGSLRDWAATLLEPSGLTATGLLNAQLVSTYWADHQSGRYNRAPQLWTVLMFMSWYKNNIGNK